DRPSRPIRDAERREPRSPPRQPLVQVQAVEHGQPVRLEEDAGPDGERLGLALEEGHPRARASGEERRRGAAGPPADDRDVLASEADGEGRCTQAPCPPATAPGTPPARPSPSPR